MKFSRSLIATIATLAASCAFSFAQDVDPKAQALVNSIVQSHIAWESKITAPGATIVAKESERSGNLVKYRLYVTGLPTDRLYTVLMWPVNQQQLSTAIEGATIGKDGVVMCAGRTKNQCGDAATPDDPIDFAVDPAPGEPTRLAIASEKFRAAIVIVPRPISGSDRGCTIQALRLLPKFALAYLTGQGFPPNSEVTFTSRSYDEDRAGKTKADAQGKVRFAILPSVVGHESGTTNLVSSSPNCSPKLSFDWGQ